VNKLPGQTSLASLVVDLKTLSLPAKWYQAWSCIKHVEKHRSVSREKLTDTQHWQKHCRWTLKTGQTI